MTNANVKERIESAERMLREARLDLNKDNAEDTLEFLRAAGRHIERAVKALEAPVHVVHRDATAGVIRREVINVR